MLLLWFKFDLNTEQVQIICTYQSCTYLFGERKKKNLFETWYQKSEILFCTLFFLERIFLLGYFYEDFTTINLFSPSAFCWFIHWQTIFQFIFCWIIDSGWCDLFWSASKTGFSIYISSGFVFDKYHFGVFSSSICWWNVWTNFLWDFSFPYSDLVYFHSHPKRRNDF